MSEYVPTLLTGEPASIAEAADIHARLTILSKWVDERKGSVTGWIHNLGEERRRIDGAAPTWRLDFGTVLLTDPKPTPRVTDQTAFAVWYDGRHPGKVEWRNVVVVDNPDRVVELLEDLQAAPTGSPQLESAALDLADAIRYDRVPYLPGDALDTVTADEQIRVVETDDGWLMVDTDTGEAVPGVTVSPPGRPQIQVRPTAATKTRLRAELDAQIGSPELTTAETP